MNTINTITNQCTHVHIHTCNPEYVTCCDVLIAELENNRTFENQISSLKIPYTPATNLTLSVIKKANRTFETVAYFIALASQMESCSTFFLENFPPESLSGTRDVCLCVCVCVHVRACVRVGGWVGGWVCACVICEYEQIFIKP